MLYDVCLWFSIMPLGKPDRICRVDALDVDDAALCALRLYHLPRVAYASVSAVFPVPGIIAYAWGPVVQEVCS